MLLRRFDIIPYRLPLVKPLVMKGQTLHEREGLIIRLEDEDGFFGLGEVAPFPGLHRETFLTAATQVAEMKICLSDRSIPENLLPMPHLVDDWLGEKKLFPSVRFGMELALLNLLADRATQPLAALLNPQFRASVSLNGLFAGRPEDLESDIPALVEAGYRAIKIKVGRRDPQTEVNLVRRTRELAPAVAIRLDANRAWSLPEALQFGRMLGDCRIEYLEEPLRDPAGLGEFHRETTLPLALDETLDEILPNDFSPPPGTAALVLKPGVIGGFEQSIRWAELARRRQLKVVVSSAFESGVGLAALANLAAALNPDDVPCGLDTYKWLAKDVIAHPFRAVNGRVDVAVVDRNARQLTVDAQW